MIETLVVLVVLMAVFLTTVQYVDNLRARLLLDYAALRAVRTRSVGYNNWKVEKSARLALASCSGKCLTRDEKGQKLSTQKMVDRMEHYLGCRTRAQARNILDFEYWDRAYLDVEVPILNGDILEETIYHTRPQFFSYENYIEGHDAAEDRPEAHLSGTAKIEAHYPVYLK